MKSVVKFNLKFYLSNQARERKFRLVCCAIYHLLLLRMKYFHRLHVSAALLSNADCLRNASDISFPLRALRLTNTFANGKREFRCLMRYGDVVRWKFDKFPAFLVLTLAVIPSTAELIRLTRPRSEPRFCQYYSSMFDANARYPSKLRLFLTFK